MDNEEKFWVYFILGLLIPFLIFLLRGIIPDDQSSFLFAILTIMVLSYLSVMYRDLSSDLDTGYRELTEDLASIKGTVHNQAVVRSINEVNWYDEFEPNLKDADDHVYISYLHNEDPRDSQDERKVKYYENVSNVIKNKSTEGVEIRRVIRGIPSLEDWIDTILEEHEGTTWYSLACIPDSEPDVVNKPHISVQLIDDNITYFVAVGEQKEETYPRDMFVKSEEMNTQWDRYYRTLWKSSLVVLERGNIDEDELERLKDHLDELRE